MSFPSGKILREAPLPAPLVSDGWRDGTRRQPSLFSSLPLGIQETPFPSGVPLVWSLFVCFKKAPKVRCCCFCSLYPLSVNKSAVPKFS